VKKARFLLPAEIEMFEAAVFYETQVEKLGIDFISAIESAVFDISENPEIYPIIGNGVRRCLLPRFPYSILYKIDPDEIIIIAIMHQKRRPNYWVDRL